MHYINTLNAELNPICHLLALLGAHHILHVSRKRFKGTRIYFLYFFLIGQEHEQNGAQLKIYGT